MTKSTTRTASTTCKYSQFSCHFRMVLSVEATDTHENRGEGQGDILEITNRRTWRTVDQWLSDWRLEFGNAVYREGSFVRTEYLYIGRTNPGSLQIEEVSVQGRDADYFSLSTVDRVVGQGEYARVAVTFRSDQPVAIGSLNSYLRIVTDSWGVTKVEITGGSMPSAIN